MKASIAALPAGPLPVGDEGRDCALLEPGNPYPAVSRYPGSLRTLDRGVLEIPDDPAMRLFPANALYHTEQAKHACERLLTVLAGTELLESIARYRNTVAGYPDDFDRTWL